MDKLEEFILRHREEFDDQVPNPQMWDAIDSGLPDISPAKHVHLNWWKYAAVAAVGLVILLSGFIGGIYLSPSGIESSEEYADFLKAEQYYSSQIHQRLDQINKLSGDKSFNEDLAQIDMVFQELKMAVESDDVQNKQQIIDALIQTYQTKIEILERVLERMQSSDTFNIKIEQDEANLEI